MICSSSRRQYKSSMSGAGMSHGLQRYWGTWLRDGLFRDIAKLGHPESACPALSFHSGKAMRMVPTILADDRLLYVKIVPDYWLDRIAFRTLGMGYIAHRRSSPRN